MAELSINLNNFPASGVYTIEVDQSENLALPLTTGRLVVGSSRVGPYNTVVLLNDLRTLRAVYGDIDPKLEKAGSYFHRTLEVALREGPVFALNVLGLDTDVDPNTNLDQASFTTFNSESASNNNSAGVPAQYPAVEFFNRRRLWFADSEQLNRSKNLALGDDFVLNPGGFGQSSIESNKILSFANLGHSNVTIWVRKSDIRGYDVTAKEWYDSIGGVDIEFPQFVHPDDFISDYFVEVIIVNGDWTNYLRLSQDPIYRQFFDTTGLKSSRASDFFALRDIRVINRTVGCLIPDFRDQAGLTVSIDRLLNRAYPLTGILCALDVEKLDKVDLENSQFTDLDVETHRVDIIGHGFDDLVLNQNYAADTGGYDTDGVTQVVHTPLIDTLSYSKPADNQLIFTLDNNALPEINLSTTIGAGEIYVVTTVGDSYLVATETSTLYESFKKGFLRTGDIITDGTNNYYVKVIDNLSAGSPSIKYIKLEVYQDILLANQVSVNQYAGIVGDYVKILIREEDINGNLVTSKEFKKVFDLTDTAFFTNYLVSQPNKITLGINISNKAVIDEFIKVNHYIKASTTSGRTRLLKIISVSSKETLSPYSLEYTITTMSPFSAEVTGLDVTNNEIQVYKGIPNFISSLKGQYLKSFKIREDLLPNSTAERQSGILEYLFTSTSIPQALATGEIVDFRYVVDSYAGEISSSSKYYLAKLAALHGQAMALLNAPSVQQFEKSVTPSFIDTTTKLVSAQYISTGGNLSLNPEFTFNFAEEDVNGVPLSSYATYYFPNLIVRSGNKNISVPPAGYISNLYVKKFRNGTPFLIVAGGRRGVINDPEVIGLEYDLTDEDRGFLEPVGHNLIVKRRGFGTLLFSNNTAYQRVNSALNNAHVRDNLSTIERDIERILFNFLFDFNDEITRLRVKTLVENYLDAVVNARGLSSYSIVFDSSNNSNELIEANTAIIDIKVDFPRGIHKFINRITITRVGGQLSSQTTGFIPSF
jgi:hypothetical protein